jgi:hypothetical protein
MYKDDGLSRAEVETLVGTFGNQALDFFGALRAATYDAQIKEWMEDVAGAQPRCARGRGRGCVVLCVLRPVQPRAAVVVRADAASPLPPPPPPPHTHHHHHYTHHTHPPPPPPTTTTTPSPASTSLSRGHSKHPAVQCHSCHTMTGAPLGAAEEARVKEVNRRLIAQKV